MKRILNKWQAHWEFHREWQMGPASGWRRLEFGILKIIKFPPEGQVLTKDCYKGFAFKFLIWLPIEKI